MGKPIDIRYKIDKFSNSYEKIDYNKEGRIKQDYLAWDFSEYTINVNYDVSYRYAKNPFNWKNKICVQLKNITFPEGFLLSLKKGYNDFQECSSDYSMLLIESKNFLIKINQIDNYIDLVQPQLVKFDINIILEGTNIRKTINYEFLVGEDLGDGWVAFDSGTTATTIAFGNDNTNIIIAKNKEEIVIPSVLVFDRKDINRSFYGDEAEKRIKSTVQYIGFPVVFKICNQILNEKRENLNKNILYLLKEL